MGGPIGVTPGAEDERGTAAMTTTGARTLANLSRTILLVGAGKMGGALLEGWLGLGLDPKYAADAGAAARA